MHACTTSNAICREPGDRIGRHKESRSCFSILPWLGSTAESKIPAGRNQHVSASAGLEKELYRDPQQSNRTAQRRSAAAKIAGHIRSACQPPPRRPHDRAAQSRGESRVICPSCLSRPRPSPAQLRRQSSTAAMTTGRDAKPDGRASKLSRAHALPIGGFLFQLAHQGRDQHRPMWEELP
jgi:hypothetical protein